MLDVPWHGRLPVSQAIHGIGPDAQSSSPIQHQEPYGWTENQAAHGFPLLNFVRAFAPFQRCSHCRAVANRPVIF
jgi:hypothetical protein